MVMRHVSKNMQTLLKNVQNQIKHINTYLPNQSKNVSTTCQRRSVDSWSNLTSSILQHSISPELALFQASQLFNSGAKPTSYALVHLLRTLKHQASAFIGQQLHSHILKSGFLSNVFISTALMSFYLKFEYLSFAHKVFDEIPEPTVVSWNSLISGYVRSGEFSKGLGLFIELNGLGFGGDEYSFSAALSACGHMCLLKFGESVHGKIVKFGSGSSIVVRNCLVDTYGKCGAVEDAVKVFDGMVDNDKDVISWNSVIAACAENGRINRAFRLLQQMPSPDTISYNEMINGFAQFGDIEDAIDVLMNMSSPNSSSYNSILTGFVNRDRASEALEFFARMRFDNVGMDQFTYSVILSGASSLAASIWGKVIHCCTIKSGLDTYVVVGSALVDMYSKCGLIKNAEMVFYSLPQKNLITWNAMISGYAHNGDFTKVVYVFELLKIVGDLKPDGITFLNVLFGCSHNQMSLENGMQYFESMVRDYGIKPIAEHCCSMIRLMGQTGQVEKAEKMIYELDFESCGVVWRALLGASVACKNLKIAKTAAAKIVELGGDDDYVFVLMSNIHACCGEWEDARVLRELMREKGVRKEAGYSWIEEESVALDS